MTKQSRLCVRRSNLETRYLPFFALSRDLITDMRFAYADPPYIGQAKRHYSADPLCAEVDHHELINRLVAEFPDGWALSASTPSLAIILPMCPSRLEDGRLV